MLQLSAFISRCVAKICIQCVKNRISESGRLQSPYHSAVHGRRESTLGVWETNKVLKKLKFVR